MRIMVNLHFLFQHIQIKTTITDPLDATIDIDKSNSYSIDKSLKCFGAYCPHLQLNRNGKGGLFLQGSCSSE